MTKKQNMSTLDWQLEFVLTLENMQTMYSSLVLLKNILEPRSSADKENSEKDTSIDAGKAMDQEINKKLEYELERLIDDNDKILSAHRFSSILHFLQHEQEVRGKAIDKTFKEFAKKSLKDMYHYFYEVEVRLQPNKEKIDHEISKKLPRYYNKVCNAIRNLSSFDSCHIVHRSALGALVAASSSEIEENDSRRKEVLEGYSLEQFVEYVIDSKGEVRELNPPTDNLLSEDAHIFTVNDTEVLLLKIAIMPKKGDRDKVGRMFLVLQRNMESHLDSQEELYSDDLKQDNEKLYNARFEIRDILLMRESLRRILDRDFFSLRAYHFSHDHIQQRDSNKTTLLHISDCHLNWHHSPKEMTPAEECLKAVCSKLGQEFASGKIDLLIVSGDIITAFGVAGNLEKRYKEAIEFLKNLAYILFTEKDADGNKLLLFDWRERIVVVPGNHDYAAMSELRSESLRREVNHGRRTRIEGSSRTKHSYFLQFYRDLVKRDIENYAENGLNEVRSYEGLKLSVISLNSSFRVNSLRSNKVALNSKVLEKIGKRPNLKEGQTANICVLHHPPKYDPDYNNDWYWEGGSPDKIPKLIEKFASICTQPDFNFDELEVLFDEFNKQTSYKENPSLYSDLLYCLQKKEEQYKADDGFQEIVDRVRGNVVMKERDRKEYSKTLKSLTEACNIQAFFCGHVHRAASNPEYKEDFNGAKQYCVDKFIVESKDDKDKDLYEGKISFNKVIFGTNGKHRPSIDTLSAAAMNVIKYSR